MDEDLDGAAFPGVYLDETLTIRLTDDLQVRQALLASSGNGELGESLIPVPAATAKPMSLDDEDATHKANEGVGHWDECVKDSANASCTIALPFHRSRKALRDKQPLLDGEDSDAEEPPNSKDDSTRMDLDDVEQPVPSQMPTPALDGTELQKLSIGAVPASSVPASPVPDFLYPFPSLPRAQKVYTSEVSKLGDENAMEAGPDGATEEEDVQMAPAKEHSGSSSSESSSDEESEEELVSHPRTLRLRVQPGTPAPSISHVPQTPQPGTYEDEEVSFSAPRRAASV